MEIKKPFKNSNKKTFGNQNIISEIKGTKFGNRKIGSAIKKTNKESKQMIILVILLEHRTQQIAGSRSTGLTDSGELVNF